MHYTAMLCYRGLGHDGRGGARGEAVPALQGRRVVAGHHRARGALISPEDNNERQQIHEHESVPLAAARRAAPSPRRRPR